VSELETAEPAPAASSRGPVIQHTSGLGVVDALVGGLAVALCVASGYSLLVFSSFTPRLCVLLVAGIPGLLIMGRRAIQKDVAAVVAVAVIAWTIVAAFFGGSPRLALLGTVGLESSALIIAMCFGVWAIGWRASERAVAILPTAVLLGAGVNAAVGVIQVVADVDSGAFAHQFSRAVGLTPNPVYFGALMAVGAATAATHARLSFPYRVGLVAFFAMALNLSGSRVALLAGLLTVIAASFARGARPAWRRVSFVPVAYVVGVAVGEVLSSAIVDARSSTERLASAGGGGRFDAWRYGLEAIADRPIAGWGFGRFRAATQGRYSADFVRTSAVDDLTQAWFDPHNVIIGVAAAIGLLGLLLVLIWASIAARRVAGPLVAPLAALALIMLLQPAGLAVLPLAMLLLGGAARTDRPASRGRVSLGVLVALLIGAAAAGWLAIGDLRLQSAIESGSAQEIDSAARWFVRDGVVADLVAQAWYIEEQFDQSLRPNVIEWSERAIRADPDRPYFRAQYAGRLLAFGDWDGSRAQLENALELQPWHTRSWYLAYFLAERMEDAALRSSAVDALCRLDQPIPECAVTGELDGGVAE
jgi:O-antigen ligase